MHTYDVPRRQDPLGGPSATPIYDALYAEYVKSFRTLPGDRSGEEDLGFSAFGSTPYRSGSFSAYSAGAFSARQQPQWQRVGHIGPQGSNVTQHFPAALPPGRSGGV
ncbi:hypothetical protein JS756_24685 [Streptomyces actuosus]|uniref:Uncharacterized protein n=1 Tax=Streptomyces actuosus TaxID=1885 RepID=A0ABS2VVR6_STRAS|nr:hypothetical protein [Streptomyces actuosus]MBN0047246.1 hypothetical protein [Streptomyces actuosus]